MTIKVVGKANGAPIWEIAPSKGSKGSKGNNKGKGKA